MANRMVAQPSPIRGRKIRAALVGCGRIAEKHFDAITVHRDHLQLTAVCDTTHSRLQSAIERTGAQGYTDYDQLLANEDADLIILTTPSGLHPLQTIKAAEAGRHVMTEKPMATRWRDGLRMVEACDEAGIYLLVVKQNRRNPTLQLLKQAVEKGRFGRIYLVTINVFWSRPQAYYDQDPWRGKWEFDGGALMNQASHYVDLLDWLIGPVESIQSYTATLARRIEVEDTAVMAVRWRSGTLGALNVTMLTYPKNLEGSITVLGEKGTARVGGVACNQITEWSFSEIDDDDQKVQNANYETTSIYGFGHRSYYENVIAALRGHAEPETDGREGLRSLEILIAAYLSARDGCRISLPLEY